MAFEILDKTNTGQAWDSLKQAESQVLQAGQNAYQQYASPEKAAQMMKSQLTKIGPSLALREQEAKYQEQLSTAPYEYRSPDFMPEVTNPLIRAKMAAQREANIEKNLATTRATQDIYEGNVADIINAAATNIKAENDRLSMELDFKKEGYQMALQEYGLVSEAEASKLAESWKQKEYDLSIKKLEEDKRQFDEQMRLSYSQLAASSSGGSSSSTLSTTKYGDERYSEAVNAALDILAYQDVITGNQGVDSSGNIKAGDMLLSPDEKKQAQNQINAIANRYGIDGNELFNQAWNEGGFNDWNAVDFSGAIYKK